MQKEDILESMKEILKQIRPAADFSDINDDLQLVRDVGLDSLTILLLSLAIENKFGFKFEGNLRFNTVGEVIDYIIANTSR